jgi:hypothetical protein
MSGTSKIVSVLSGLVALGMLAACTTSTSSTSSKGAGSAEGATISTRSPAPAGAGTEVIQASTTVPDPVRATVRASGVFTDTGTLKLPLGNPRTITLQLTRGNLVVLNATGPAGFPRQLDTRTCVLSQSLGGTYRVLSGNSTGSYAGATGHGTYVYIFSGIAPRTSAGGCNRASNATPAKSQTRVVFRGLLVLNEGTGAS